MLQQVVYISAATKVFEADDLERLLAKARRRNEQSGVTGVLLYDNDSFLQVLEGAPADLERTLARIRRDPRHTGFTVVQDQRIERRDFGDWSMAYSAAQSGELNHLRQGRRLDRDFVGSLVTRISQPVAKVFVRQFGDHAQR
jgi:FAD-dependent sensor of blue light